MINLISIFFGVDVWPAKLTLSRENLRTRAGVISEHTESMYTPS